MSNCTHCGCNKLSCGCKDSYLTTPPACPTPVDCPEAQPCSETFDSQCIIYTGADILCGLQTVIQQDDTVAETLKNIIDYICYKTTVASPILCGTDVVVTSGTPVLGALVSMTNYFCTEIANLPTTTVVGGTGISVTSNTVGTNTAYTVNATGVKKYVDTFQSVFGADIFTVLGSDLIACGLLDDPACSNGQLVQLPTDLIINIYHKPSGATNWNSTSIVTPGQPGVFFEINPTTGNILFTFNLPLVSPAADVRVVIIG